MTDKTLVHRIDEGVDRREVYATTYQMRNFYRQFLDGWLSPLEVMNYIQHHQVTKWCKPKHRLLDVCCGRGLMLPLLRYHAKDIGGYTGVDIKASNAVFTDRRVTDGKPLADLVDDPDGYYPFPVHFVEADAAEMAAPLHDQGLAPFDIIIYTSALEHMHYDAGSASLEQCRAVARDGSLLVLTTPRTEVGADGYDTRYRAHVYEWQRDELREALDRCGWDVITEWGLTIGKRDLLAAAERLGLRQVVERQAKFVPSEWLTAVWAPMFPAEATELGLLCRARPAVG